MIFQKNVSEGESHPRLVPRTGKLEIVRIGHQQLWFRDMYVWLLAMPWLGLIGLSAIIYLISNLAFAVIYYELHDGIEKASTFADMFFFSVQTMATIGYGRLAPIGPIANLLVTIEALWGFSFFAFVTGLTFAKFSHPTAQVLFSDVAVISEYEGKPHLKIRLANQRANRIVDANVHLYLLRDIVTKEGYRMRRFFDLKLVRNDVPFMRLTWTLLHPIDEDSPLFGATAESMEKDNDEIVVALVGVDETMAQTIHAHHSYISSEIVHGAYFEDVLSQRGGKLEVNFHMFHAVRKQGELPRSTSNAGGMH